MISSRRCIVKLKTITVDLPLLIIREGTQRENVAPVRILKDLGIDYIGQCNFVVTFIQRKDDGWLRRGGSYGLDSKVYLFIDTRQLAAGVPAACSGSGQVLGSSSWGFQGIYYTPKLSRKAVTSSLFFLRSET
jgi:hypothetical protein